MGKTLSNFSTPDQWAVLGNLSSLANEDYSPANHFNLDNQNDEAVTLSVKGAGMETFESMKIYPGPNLVLLKEIAKNTILTPTQLLNIKTGY